MPIYAYKCSSCGHAKDVLQKMSDAPLTNCPACGQETFTKQVTAAGFQLKGSGWYVTDFREGASAAKSSEGGSVPKASEPAVSTVSTDTSPSSTPATTSPSSNSSSAGQTASASATNTSSSTGSSNE